MIQGSVYDAFAEQLAKHVAAFKTGNGLEEGVNIGPLINPAAISKVEELVEDAINKGAKAVLGGKRTKNVGAQFCEPTILTKVTEDMGIFSNEIFGLVAPLFRFKTEEVIAMVNDTPFGLAS